MTTRFLTTAALALALTVSALARGEEAARFLEEEDRIDRIEPARQMDEYVRLRGRLLESRSDFAQAALLRLALKLELANARARHADPDHATRLAMSELAARIGESHLRQNDPDRAHRHEALARTLEPGGGHASVLRNAINGWFSEELTRSLARADWIEARETLAKWRRLIGDDPAIDAETVRFARERARHLVAELPVRGAPAVLREARWEEERYRAREVWEDLRGEVARSLQRPFEESIAERRVEEAGAALARQKAVAHEFAFAEEIAPVAANEDRLRRLAEDLMPPPLERPFGHVLYPVFRLEVGSRLGGGSFTGRGEIVEEPGTAGELSLSYRRAGDARRFFGAEVTVSAVSASDGPASCSAAFAAAHLHYGARGERWAAWGGVGLVYAAVDFTGQSISDDGHGLALGSVRLGGERAIGESFAVFLDGDFLATDAISRGRARLGLRYYANRNFAVSVFATGDDFRVRDSSTGADTRGDFLGGGFSAAIQF